VCAGEISIHWKGEGHERKKTFNRTLQRHSVEPRIKQRGPCRSNPESLRKQHTGFALSRFLCPVAGRPADPGDDVHLWLDQGSHDQENRYGRERKRLSGSLNRHVKNRTDTIKKARICGLFFNGA
jgi:hypothetical protein